MKPLRIILAVVISGFLPDTSMYAQGNEQQKFTTRLSEMLEAVSDTIELRIKDMSIYPCSKGKSTLQLTASNTSDERFILAVHIQSNIRLASSVGRGWGMVFYDTIPAGEEIPVEHSFPLYSDLNKGITLRVQFYQLHMSESWEFDKYFFSRTFDDREMVSLCQSKYLFTEHPELNAAEKFLQIQGKLGEEDFTGVWNSLSLSFQEAKYQNDIDGFLSDMGAEQALDTWTASQFLQLVPDESSVLEDGRILLKLTLDRQPWKVHFKFVNDSWKMDWIEGYTSLVDRWKTWQTRLMPQMQKFSTRHFDFYCFADSYAASAMNDIARTREEGYEKICKYLDLHTGQRISTFFFNDPATKAIETGHRGKGAAFDTTIIEVYSNDMQANPYHESVHILAGKLGYPPALFNEGFAEYMEIVLSGKDSLILHEALDQTIKGLGDSEEWIPIRELFTFTDIPGNSPAYVSYPEAAAFVKFLIETYGRHKFMESFRELHNPDQEAILEENIRKFEVIYGKPVEILIDEFHQFYGISLTS
jgi:hypothetical protein